MVEVEHRTVDVGGLRRHIAGHWTQQERAAEVSARLVAVCREICG